MRSDLTSIRRKRWKSPKPMRGADSIANRNLFLNDEQCSGIVPTSQSNAEEQRKDGAAMEGGLRSLNAPDLERYRHHLAQLGLPREREDEIMLAIWPIMSSFIDRAFGDDPVQHLGRSVDRLPSSAPPSNPGVVSSGTNTPNENQSRLSRAFTPLADGREEDS